TGRRAGFLDAPGDPPAPAEFHGARVDEVGARMGLVAVAVERLDEQACRAAPAELEGKREAHRAAADDEDGSFDIHDRPFKIRRWGFRALRHWSSACFSPPRRTPSRFSRRARSPWCSPPHPEIRPT